MNQPEFREITRNLFKTREKLRAQGAIGFGSHWLKSWREILKPIAKFGNGSRVIAFDSH